MEKQVIRRLNCLYYSVMCAAVVVAVVMYMLLQKGVVTVLDSNSAWGMAVQYFVILDTLVTVPFGLWLCKRRCKKISKLEDDGQKVRLYGDYAGRRVLTVSNSMVWGVLAFYLLGGYKPMLWMAAIAAIGWYFCKPTERKMQLELLPYDDSY